jgi:ketosteroid isomerase-like protein
LTFCAAVSERDLNFTHQIYAAWNRGDVDWFVEHLADDARIQPIRDLPEFEEVYVGPQGWQRFWEVWRDKWSGISVERLEDINEHGVLALLTLEGEGGAGYGSMPVSHWLQFIDGKIAGLTAMTPDAAERRRAERD